MRDLEAIISALDVLGLDTTDARSALGRYWRDGVSAQVASRLATLRAQPRVRAHELFTRILGVGPATALKWVDAGILTLPDLRKRIGDGTIKLTRMQTIGLKYCVDLAQRIPRAEVTRIIADMRRVCGYVSSTAQVEPAGSYRRGAADSGDVDIITVGVPMQRLAAELAAEPNFVELVVSGPERVTILWQCARPRQVDILAVTKSSLALALNYFTGGFVHNTWLRGVAKSKGYRLNQRELTRNGSRVVVKTERDLYRILGCEWVEPVNRL